METRQERGKQIAKTLGKYIRKTSDGWKVPSQTTNDLYSVSEDFVCSCPDSQKRNAQCKHSFALRYYLQAENAAGQVVHKQRLTYKQAWKSYTQAQTQEIRLFDELLRDLMQEVEEPVQVGAGRRQTPLREALFCAIQKVYSQLSSRRAASLYFNANEKKQITKAPNYNVINVLLNREDLTPLLHQLIAITASPLKAVETDFAVDSSGFRTTCFGLYCEEKYELDRQRGWLKAHVLSGVKTNCVAAVEITGEYGADSPQLPVLVERTANNGFQIQRLVADKAYNGRPNYNAVEKVGGELFSPFKQGTTPNQKGSQAWKKAYHFFELHQSEFFAVYSKRANAESTFSAIKKKFGETLKSKNRVAQVNELLCKLVAHNIVVLVMEMHELGVKPDFSKVEGIN